MIVVISALCVSSLLFTESLSSLTFTRCFGRSAFQNIPPHRGCCISVPTEILALTYFIFYLAGHESLLKWMTGSSIRETGEECHWDSTSGCPPSEEQLYKRINVHSCVLAWTSKHTEPFSIWKTAGLNEKWNTEACVKATHRNEVYIFSSILRPQKFSISLFGLLKQLHIKGEAGK